MSTELDQFAEFSDEPVAGEGVAIEQRDSFAPPTPGRVTLERADGDIKSGETTAKDGQRMAWFQLPFKIVGGPEDGRYVFDGCNTYVGQFGVSSAEEYLQACGSPLSRKTIREYAIAVTKTVTPFEAVLDWEWRCNNQGCRQTFLEGSKNPRKPKKYTGQIHPVQRTKDGAVDYEQKCPTCGEAVAAQAKIKRYVVKNAATRTATVTSNGNGVAMPPAEG